VKLKKNVYLSNILKRQEFYPLVEYYVLRSEIILVHIVFSLHPILAITSKGDETNFNYISFKAFKKATTHMMFDLE
jgi:hypothetical protein